VHGDIAFVNTEVVVNAANVNSFLLSDAGVSGALLKACFPEQLQAIAAQKQLWNANGAPGRYTTTIPEDEAASHRAFGRLVTQGVKHIVHAVGPKWKNIASENINAMLTEGARRIQKACEAALRVSAYLKCASVTIPVLSSGEFTHTEPAKRLKEQECALKSLFRAIAKHCEGNTPLKHIIIMGDKSIVGAVHTLWVDLRGQVPPYMVAVKAGAPTTFPQRAMASLHSSVADEQVQQKVAAAASAQLANKQWSKLREAVSRTEDWSLFRATIITNPMVEFYKLGDEAGNILDSMYTSQEENFSKTMTALANEVINHFGDRHDALDRYVGNIGYVLLDFEAILKEATRERAIDQGGAYRILDVPGDGRCMLHALARLVGKNTSGIRTGDDSSKQALTTAIHDFVHLPSYTQLIDDGLYSFATSDFVQLLEGDTNNKGSKVFAELKKADVTHLVVGGFHNTLVKGILDEAVGRGKKNGPLRIRRSFSDRGEGFANGSSFQGADAVIFNLSDPSIVGDHPFETDDPKYITLDGKTPLDKLVFVCTTGSHYTLVVPNNYPL